MQRILLKDKTQQIHTDFERFIIESGSYTRLVYIEDKKKIDKGLVGVQQHFTQTLVKTEDVL